jgi:hypothetical protein
VHMVSGRVSVFRTWILSTFYGARILTWVSPKSSMTMMLRRRAKQSLQNRQFLRYVLSPISGDTDFTHVIRLSTNHVHVLLADIG